MNCMNYYYDELPSHGVKKSWKSDNVHLHHLLSMHLKRCTKAPVFMFFFFFFIVTHTHTSAHTHAHTSCEIYTVSNLSDIVMIVGG